MHLLSSLSKLNIVPYLLVPDQTFSFLFKETNQEIYCWVAGALKQGLVLLTHLVSNLPSSCLSLSSSGIAGVYHHAWSKICNLSLHISL
jgi:hypothetical protein